ncbi:MAG: hypothetical protein A2W28_00340 [Gammaproteobacteria bacterium RBG_16_51_14]|nr:MAG: hypothetical protein A2W28_00340 [Gammaproteobacteria bacterium RBG_16_51_14]
MQVTYDLMEEHKLIVKYIDLMDQYIHLNQANQGEAFFLEKADIFVSFIRNFADTFHHAKEEDILFRYLEVPGVLSHCNPLPQMLFEHDQGRHFVQLMKMAIQNGELNHLIENAWNYGQLLRAHIYKEDNILYPMAEAGIQDKDKIRLLDEYREAEERMSSQAIWIEYKDKYKTLEEHLHEMQLACSKPAIAM